MWLNIVFKFDICNQNWHFVTSEMTTFKKKTSLFFCLFLHVISVLSLLLLNLLHYFTLNPAFLEGVELGLHNMSSEGKAFLNITQNAKQRVGVWVKHLDAHRGGQLLSRRGRGPKLLNLFVLQSRLMDWADSRQHLAVSTRSSAAARMLRWLMAAARSQQRRKLSIWV